MNGLFGLFCGIALLVAATGYSDLKANSQPTNYPRITKNEPPAPQKPVEDSYKEILSLIENQLTALQGNQIAKAYKDYTSDQFKQVTSEEEFKYFVNGYPGFSQNKNAFFGNIEKKPQGVSSIQGTLISANGETMNVEYDLIKENGIMKIIGIRVFTVQQQPQLENSEGPHKP